VPETQSGHLLGYARVSTVDQNPELQHDALERAGCYRIWTDHGVSGKLTSRPELDRVLDFGGWTKTFTDPGCARPSSIG
jgi:hypothetical protein